MENKYLITQEQLRLISHYKRMFEMNAEYIQGLCPSEKYVIVYGYELGKIHSHLRECFTDMMVLETEINNQSVENK